MPQKWKTDEKLYGAPTEVNGSQVNKKLDYSTVYRKEFLDCDPLRDWESISRCIWLWSWAIDVLQQKSETIIPVHDWYVLDCGTKDCQFPEYLVERSVNALGVEYSKEYVDYASEKGRPIILGNVCDLEFEDNTYDMVFSHHLHGLTPDYLKALQEMYRVSKKYMIALNQVPGNPRKHYSYIDSSGIFYEFMYSIEGEFEVLYNDYLDTGISNEWVIFLEKK